MQIAKNRRKIIRFKEKVVIFGHFWGGGWSDLRRRSEKVKVKKRVRWEELEKSGFGGFEGFERRGLGVIFGVKKVLKNRGF